MLCNKEECPICFEPLSDDEISIECPTCKKKFNLSCILQSCKTFWNRNEKCTCPICRGDLHRDDYLKLIDAIKEEIEKNEKNLSELRDKYSADISNIIKQMYALGDSNITKVEGDPAKLEEINRLENENNSLNRQLNILTRIPGYDSGLGGSPSRRYKKKTIRRNRKTAKGKKNKRHSRKHNRK